MKVAWYEMLWYFMLVYQIVCNVLLLKLMLPVKIRSSSCISTNLRVHSVRHGVHQSDRLWVEAAFEPSCSGLNAPQPLARGEGVKQSMGRVGLGDLGGVLLPLFILHH